MWDEGCAGISAISRLQAYGSTLREAARRRERPQHASGLFALAGGFPAALVDGHRRRAVTGRCGPSDGAQSWHIPATERISVPDEGRTSARLSRSAHLLRYSECYYHHQSLERLRHSRADAGVRLGAVSVREWLPVPRSRLRSGTPGYSQRAGPPAAAANLE